MARILFFQVLHLLVGGEEVIEQVLQVMVVLEVGDVGIILIAFPVTEPQGRATQEEQEIIALLPMVAEGVVAQVKSGRTVVTPLVVMVVMVFLRASQVPLYIGLVVVVVQ
jgi:hypothetical protein